MYNEKQKMAYLNYIADEGINKRIIPILTKRFSLTEPFEQALDKDLCEWTAHEIIDYYQSLVNRSLESLLMIHSHLNGYARWCLINARVRDSQNHFEELDREIINAKCINTGYLNQGIVTRDELLKMLKTPKILNAYERFLLLGLFEGIGGAGYSDFQFLTMDDFDGETVHLPHQRSFTVSKELIRYAREASEDFEYHPYGTSKRAWTFDKEDKRIVKRKENGRNDLQIDELSSKGFRHIIALNLKRLSEECDTPTFSNAMLFESGRLHMIREWMRKDKSDAETVIKAHDDEIALRYGKIYGRARYLDKWASFLALTD